MNDSSPALPGNSRPQAPLRLAAVVIGPSTLAGGSFRHGQHLAFDRDRNYPLPKLFISLLQRLGVETDRFAGQVWTMSGLELA